MNRRRTSARVLLLLAVLLGLLALVAAQLLTRPAGAAPALPARYAPNPPRIVVTAPFAGTYALIEHAPDGDRLITHATLEAGWVAHFLMVKTDGRTPYHVQVSRGEPDEPLEIWETPRYPGIWALYLPMIHHHHGPAQRAPLAGASVSAWSVSRGRPT